MHFHLPKPLHGWREFAGEVGIIVIGVLIALGAEQVVEELHWHSAVDDERRALHIAVARELTESSGRLVQEPCIERRLNDLLTVFARHKAGVPLRMVGRVGVPAVVGASTDAWQTAAGGETLDHMPLDERLSLGASFASFAVMRSDLNQEAREWDQLSRLDHPEILEADDWSQLRAAYAEAAAWDGRNNFFARWVLKYDTHGERPDSVSLKDLKAKGSVLALCQPLLSR
jgi:hypothetical protein